MGLVYVNTKDAIRRVRSGFKELSQDQIYKSIARAINTTLGTTRTQINRRIRETYNISASAINERMYVLRSNYTNLTGKIQLATRTLPLAEFNPTQREGAVVTQYVGGRKKGLASKLSQRKQTEPAYALMVEVIRGEVRAIPSAYFKISAALNSRVVARGEYGAGFEFSQHKAIRTLKSVSIYNIVIGGRIHKEMRLYVEQRFSINIERELNVRLQEMAAHSIP